MKISALFFLLLITLLLNAQTGPGGIGSSINNNVWLDASTITGVADNSPISVWNDISGNGNFTNQPMTDNQPLYIANAVNNFPAIRFDGVNDYMDFSSNINNAGITLFAVYKSANSTASGNNLGAVSVLENHVLLAQENSALTAYSNPNTFPTITAPNNQFNVLSLRTNSNPVSGLLGLTSNSTVRNVSRNNYFTAFDTSSIGMSKFSGSYIQPLDGEIAELIYYNNAINTAELSIIITYLATKYDLNVGQNVFAYRTTHKHGLIGIGRLNGVNNTARGRGNLLISNPSDLDMNMEFLTIANDNGGFSPSISVPSNIRERWTQTWRAGLLNTPGTIDLEFFLDGNDLTGLTSAYVLLIDDDGDFTNGGTTQNTSGTFNAINQSVSFSGIDFADGDYFTLAIEDNLFANAIASGTWDNPLTWDCNCVPNETDDATIGFPFIVTIDDKARINTLTINPGGELTFGSDDTLDIEGNFVLNSGTLNMNQMGTIAATGTVSQTIGNNFGSPTDLNNLFINNASGVNIQNGSWSISNNLQVSAGNLNVTGIDSIVLLSTASKTSQILQSVDNAFTGTFKVERYISDRNSNYANFSSTVESTTLADLDDDLFLSGIGGNNGDAVFPDGSAFLSVFRYDRPSDSHVAITSTSTLFSPGEGYEVFLGTTLERFTNEGFSFEGVPNTGTVSTTIDQGFNLVGNPYHSFIDFDLTDKSNIDDVYYIFNSSTGSYNTESAIAKPPIAASQGFWISKSTAGSVNYNFEESHKVSNTSSSFVRKKNRKTTTLKLSDENNVERHSLSLEFNNYSSNELDPKDVKHLPSPFEHIPQITSKAKNSSIDLVNNSLSSEEEVQLIPINIKAENGKDLKITTENIEAIYSNYSCAYLKDNSTGRIIDLTVEDELEFTANANSNRFKLALSNSFNDCQKLLENNTIKQTINHSLALSNTNGNWFLNFNLSDEIQNLTISLYNMNGQLVSENKTITVSGEGNYLLNNLNLKEGIYLIQVKGKDLFLNKSIRF